MSTIAQPSLILPKFLAADRRLSDTAKHVLALLEDYRHKVTGRCNPRVRRLAADLGLCERTIYRALAELRKWGLITIQRIQYACQYIVAARDQWRNLLCKTVPQVEEITRPEEAPAAPPPSAADLTDLSGLNGEVDCQSCQVWPDNLVRSEPPVSLLTEPTYRTYLPKTGDAVPPRKADHVDARARKAAAAAPPSSSVENFQGQRISLRSPFTVKLCEKLLASHPQPGLPLKALVKLDAILGDDSDTAMRCAKTIEVRHGQWIEYWNTLEAGKFIPMLWRWLEAGDWMQVPVIRKPALRAYATKGERVDRMHQDGMAKAEEIDRKRRAKGIFYAPEKPEDYNPSTGELWKQAVS